MKRNGVDIHSFKEEYLGKKALISRYDIYVDTTDDIRKVINPRNFLPSDYYVIQSVWLIDIDGFMQTIAPKEYPSNSTMPRLRCIQTAVKEYNQSHERQIDKHVVEKCMLSDKVFKYHHGNRWIINYDELEPVIDEFLDKKVGIN